MKLIFPRSLGMPRSRTDGKLEEIFFAAVCLYSYYCYVCSCLYTLPPYLHSRSSTSFGGTAQFEKQMEENSVVGDDVVEAKE